MSLSRLSSVRRLSCLVALCLLSLILTGCKGGGKKAVVHGKVTFDKKPMPGGTISFLSADGSRAASGAINAADGSYRIADVPVGSMQITVQSVPRMMGPAAAPPKGVPPMRDPNKPDAASGEAAGKYVELPPRYQDPKQSGLTYDVHAGEQEHNVELSSR